MRYVSVLQSPPPSDWSANKMGAGPVDTVQHKGLWLVETGSDVTFPPYFLPCRFRTLFGTGSEARSLPVGVS